MQPETQGRIPCDDGSRDWSSAATGKAHLGPSEPGGARKESCLEALEGTLLCPLLDMRLIVSRTAKSVFVF